MLQAPRILNGPKSIAPRNIVLRAAVAVAVVVVVMVVVVAVAMVTVAVAAAVATVGGLALATRHVGAADGACTC